MPHKMPLPYRTMLEESRRRLDRVVERSGVKPMARLYDRAISGLTRRLSKIASPKTTYTAHQHRLMIAQLRQGRALLARRMRGQLGDISKTAQVEALRGLATDLTKLEAGFTGAEVVLPIDEAARFEGVITGRRESLLRAHDVSIAEWTMAGVEKMEGELSMSLLMGEDFGTAVARVEQAAGAEWWQAERIVRTECLPGSSLVTGAVVRAVSRRWYEGPMAEIVTEHGRKLTATPNHPMLTRRGWVPAGSLNQLDDLICHSGEQNFLSPRDEDVTAGPATIGEIFDAVSAVGVRERRRTAQPDFHGDGVDGDVDIFCPDRFLRFGRFAAVNKPSVQQVLTPTDKTGLGFCPRCGNLLVVAKSCCACHPSQANPRILKASPDKSISYAECLRQCVAALSLFVPFHELLYRGPDFFSRMLASPAVECFAGIGQGSGYLCGGNDFAQPCGADPGLRRDSIYAEPREIELDRVRSVRLTSFLGHVYNLHTPHGYYTMNGTYTGNTSMAFNATQADGIKECADELPDLWLRWSEHVDDDTFEPLDNRVAKDSIIMHGLIARPGEMFRMPISMPDGSPIPPKVWSRVKHLADKQWPAPPNRPNDRSCVSPWRPHWGIPAWRLEGGLRVPMQ